MPVIGLINRLTDDPRPSLAVAAVEGGKIGEGWGKKQKERAKPKLLDL